MTLEKLPLQRLVKEIAKRSKQTGLSTMEFKKKVEETLGKTPGIEKAQAKKIAEGLRSGTAKLSKEQTIKVLRGLKGGKVLKNIPDVAGEVNRFIRKQAGEKEADQNKVRSENLRKNLILQRRQEALAREAEAAKTARTPEPAVSPRYVEFSPSPLTAPTSAPIAPATPVNSAPITNSGNNQNLNEQAASPSDQDEPEDLPLAA